MLIPLPGRASIALVDTPCIFPDKAPAVDVEAERDSDSDLTLLIAPVTLRLDCVPYPTTITSYKD